MDLILLASIKPVQNLILKNSVGLIRHLLNTDDSELKMMLEARSDAAKGSR